MDFKRTVCVTNYKKVDDKRYTVNGKDAYTVSYHQCADQGKHFTFHISVNGFNTGVNIDLSSDAAKVDAEQYQGAIRALVLKAIVIYKEIEKAFNENVAVIESFENKPK